jgi:hypothetical protein
MEKRLVSMKDGKGIENEGKKSQGEVDKGTCANYKIGKVSAPSLSPTISYLKHFQHHFLL